MPDNPDSRDAVAYQHYQLGMILFNRGRFQNAQREANLALGIASQLAEEVPEKPLYLNNVARSLELSAMVQHEAGRIAEMTGTLRRMLNVNLRLVRHDPGNPHYPLQVASAQQKLAEALRQQGELDEEESLLAEALASAEQQARAFPYDDLRRSRALDLQTDLARVRSEKGRGEEAE